MHYLKQHSPLARQIFFAALHWPKRSTFGLDPRTSDNENSELYNTEEEFEEQPVVSTLATPSKRRSCREGKFSSNSHY